EGEPAVGALVVANREGRRRGLRGPLHGFPLLATIIPAAMRSEARSWALIESTASTISRKVESCPIMAASQNPATSSHFIPRPKGRRPSTKERNETKVSPEPFFNSRHGWSVAASTIDARTLENLIQSSFE